MSIARLAGIGFPTRIPILELLLRNEQIKKTGKEFLNSKWVPLLFKNILLKAWVMTMNWISLVLGAGMVDPIVRKECQSVVEPFIRDFKDFTNSEKVIANHPFVIGEYVRKHVEEWRIRTISQLQSKLNLIKVDLQENLQENSQKDLQKEKEIEFLIQEIENTRYSIAPMYRMPTSI